MTTTWLPSGFRFVSPSLPGLKSKHTVTGMRSLSKILWLVVGTWWFQPKSSHDWMMRIQKFRWKLPIFQWNFSLHLSIVKTAEIFAARSWFRKFYDSFLSRRWSSIWTTSFFGGHHGTWWEAWQPQHPLHPSHQNSSQGHCLQGHTMCHCNQNAVLICFSWFDSCWLQDFATIKISVPFAPRHPVQQISNPPVPPVRASSSSSWRPLGSGKPWNGNEFLFIAYIVEPFQLWIVW